MIRIFLMRKPKGGGKGMLRAEVIVTGEGKGSLNWLPKWERKRRFRRRQDGESHRVCYLITLFGIGALGWPSSPQTCGKFLNPCEPQFLMNKTVVTVSIIQELLKIKCEMSIKPQQNVLYVIFYHFEFWLWVVTMVFQFQEMKFQCITTPWLRSWLYGVQIARQPWQNWGTAFVSTMWVPWGHVGDPDDLCLSTAKDDSQVGSLCPCQLISTSYPGGRNKLISHSHGSE